jgi:hypothetical protein
MRLLGCQLSSLLGELLQLDHECLVVLIVAFVALDESRVVDQIGIGVIVVQIIHHALQVHTNGPLVVVDALSCAR